MANPSSKALYSTCVACLGFVCFAVGATAVGLPLWGYFEDPGGRIIRETGYFGPWQVCKKLPYNREKCGPEANTFRPIEAVYFSGVTAAFGVTFLGIFCILSVLQMAMVTQKDKVVMSYLRCVAAKLVLAALSIILAFSFLASFAFFVFLLVSALSIRWDASTLTNLSLWFHLPTALPSSTMLAIVSAGLFALQTDDRKNNFRVSRGESFYIQILLIILNFILFIMSLYDYLFSRRLGGDPTMSCRDPEGEAATTYNNPHFRENSTKYGISMTDASGKPHVHAPNYNGSVVSVTTLSTTTSNGSSVTRSPLRSSLKKPRPPGDSSLGIQNPGFSQGSPTMQRNGSVKKVRIQTHSTAV